jgi:hypothetical protein
MVTSIKSTILRSIWIEGCASGIFEQIDLSQRKLIKWVEAEFCEAFVAGEIEICAYCGSV